MKVFLALLVIFCAWTSPSPAQTSDIDYTAFRELPIQNGGRIKPMDTFAKAMLTGLSGKSASADAWLAETLFDPARAMERPVFRTYSPALLGLHDRDGHLYSFNEIAPALAAQKDALQSLATRDEKDWSADERELARLQELSILYEGLLRSFYDLMPLDITVPDSLARAWKLPPDAPVTLAQLKARQADIEKAVARIVRAKGKDPKNYSDYEKDIASFAYGVSRLASGAAPNGFPILPHADGWQSPGAADASPYLTAWETMAQAYRDGDKATFDTAARNAKEMSRTFDGTRAISAEIFYNTAHPLDIATALYALAFLTVIVWGLRRSERLRLAALALLALGGVANLAAIALRVLILARPPVGTLYESMLFVAFVCAAIAVAIEWMRKDGTGVLAGPVAALLLLFSARAFADDDSMQVLVAVLNTNFWLATHVLCITMGYGWCVIAALVAHLSLFRAGRGGGAPSMMPTIKTLCLVALFFTAFGTILGGIWADQSWGRFWGWDPKENGALLIVLWLIWLLHGQVGGQISRLWFTAGVAALAIVVALSWFGVNLLGTGLHSYGFITGVAAALGAFCAVEAAFILSCAYLAGKKP